MNILAIDPGTFESGWCLIDTDGYHPLMFDKSDNEYVRQRIWLLNPDIVVIEKLVSYGMRIGTETLETCEWVGRFAQFAEDHGVMRVEYVKRMEEKRCICGTPTANDKMIRDALIERFARHDKKTGKGTKGNPDWFYGFRADVWQAYAVGVTYLMKKGELK